MTEQARMSLHGSQTMVVVIVKRIFRSRDIETFSISVKILSCFLKKESFCTVSQLILSILQEVADDK